MSFVSTTQLQPGGGDGSPACAVVVFAGDLDAFTATAARSELHHVLATPAVILDLSDVTFLDTAGVRVLITAARSVADHDGTVVTVLPQGGAARQLHLVGFDRVVPTVPTREEARTFVERRHADADRAA